MFGSSARFIHCWIYKVLLCMFIMLGHVFGINITAQYPQDGTSPYQFRNLAIDVGTGKLYAGALNHLIQLDENLSSLMDITTGPVLDDSTCYQSIGQDPCYDLSANPISLKPTDNYNKVLVVDVKHQQLVVCGSVYQGSCETRDLQNLTDVTRYIGTLVASHSPIYSTVAFTGPGPDRDDVLYVGNYISWSSGTGTLWYPYNVNGVSSRNLIGSKFQLSYKFTGTYTYGTFSFLTPSAAAIYNINYIAGFSIQGFSYFLTQQPESYTVGPPPSVSPQVISKIVQVCQNDKNYDSYVEMQIQCKSNGVDYTLVQAATFVHPGSNLASALNISTDDYVLLAVIAITSSSQASSALCMFKLGDIRDKFTQNINTCRNNASLQVGSQFYESSRSCQPNSAINNSFCGATPFYPSSRNSPLVGTIPLVSSLPSLILDNPPVNVTALATTQEENHTVLFMGTSNGGMIKVLLDSINGSVYDSTQLMPSSTTLPINPDLLLSLNKTHLYAMTSSTIYKVPTSECNQYTTCSRCLTARDPYCGWCTLLNSCRRRSLCPNASMPIYWITPYSSNTMECPNISNVDPSTADVNSNVTVKISVSQLPTLPSPAFYSCVFGSDSFISKADVTNNQLVCQLPQMKPTVSSTIGSLLVNLTLQSSSYGVKFLQTSFTFYNCSSNSNCKTCTSSSWKCMWCVASSLCLDQRNSSFCDVSSNRLLNDSNTCPRIQSSSVNNLVVSGVATVIELTVLNLPNSTQFFCGLSTAPQTFLPASKSGDNSKLFCNSSEYSSLPNDNQVLDITALWGPNKYLLDGIYTITVYDCSMMSGRDCSKCKSFASGPLSIYNCSWCESGCQAPQNCHAQVSLCPKASVTSIGPLVGPMEGGTKLTITGTNIGMNDNQVHIYIGSKLCTSANNYTVSVRYVCIVPPVVSLVSCKICPINITIANGVMQNNFVFSYMNIFLESISPSSGPISGGTHVTIHGNDLSIDEGTAVSVNFADQSCEIIRSECNQTQLVFLSPSVANSATINRIAITIDGTTRQLATTYTYVSNPAITSVTPVSAYKSGGCVITATGRHLDASQTARVDFTSGNDLLSTITPYQRNESSLQFRSPSFPSDSVTVNMTFTLDGIQYNSNFSILPDPVIAPFDDNKLVSTSSVLTIKKVRGLLGRNFCTDVRIIVGSQNCPLLSGYDGTTDQLLCTLSNVTGGSYSVNVTVGWLNFYLGELVVPTSGASGTTTNSTDIIWQIIVGVIGGILLIIIIIIIIFARKYSASKRECEDLMKAIDDLERNYRNDCRQAFTELQTDISDFDSDIRDVGIPFLDYRMYSYMLLYPMKNVETILHVNKKSPVVGCDQKMHKFNQLLNYKHFLLTFIRTLENQTKDFSIKDKARVASLLSLILLDKLDYATEIIKILLEELIQKSMNQNPKIMLRRAESVVEKLLANWLSLSMYDYLTTHAGAPLYMLYKAIKHQTEKGPIDACTAEAKYTMSEDRLLREKIEPKDLTINVLDDSYQKFTCKMLDCDTISQAKEKALDAIYRISPYSKRPTLHQVELKYLLITDSTLAKAGNDTVTLNDEDQTMEMVNGWKKINTLGHYHIPDGASMQLLQIQNDEGTLRRNYCGKLELGGGALNPIQLGEDVKLFHLVKHEEENAVDTKASKTIKVITEIFLPRLLSTKLTLEEYINHLFGSILQVNSSLPPTVKYLFDLLDSEASKYGISADQDIVHIWKSNSLPLRFWVNLIKNPEFLFDINKTPAIDCCLSVIAQTFMDSCSTQEFKLTKDSPSTKLLFAKDLPRYQEMVRNFYEGVQALPPISEKEMIGRMCTYSRKVTDFNMEFALRDLYSYALKFKYEFAEALDNNPSTHKMNFATKFDQLELEVEEGQGN